MRDQVRDWRSLKLIGLVLTGMAGWYLWVGPPQERFDHGPRSRLKERPSQINRARVADLSLRLNGEEFGNHRHVIAQEATVTLTGHLLWIVSAIPPGAWPELKLSLRPMSQNGVDEDWDVDDRTRYWEWPCTPLGLERKINEAYKVSGKDLAPGEYHARLYLIVEDQELGNNTVDLLEAATVTIVPPPLDRMQ